MKLESKKDEKTGRMMMAEVSGSEYTVNAELVLIAAGFLGSEDYVTKAFGVEVNERTNVKTAPGEYKTNVRIYYGRRYAQRTVAGCVGNPGRKRSGTADRSGSDGVYESVSTVISGV